MWLGDYAILQGWYEDHKMSRRLSPSDTLLSGIAKSIAEQDSFHVEDLIQSLDDFVLRSENFQQDYEQTELFLRSDDFDIDQYWSQSTHIVVLSDYSEVFYQSFYQFSQRLSRPSVHFLSAWMAFNLEKVEQCISICFDIQPPFGAVWTLCGQAQLESGDPDSAVESLTKATQILPNDLLSWFQLAKASWAGNDYILCEATLEKCWKLSPEHPEVLLFSCMVGQQLKSKLLGRVWETIQDLDDPGLLNKIDFAVEFLRMTVVQQRKDAANWLVTRVEWSDLFKQSQFMPELAALLRDMHDLGWDDLCALALADLKSEREAMATESMIL